MGKKSSKEPKDKKKDEIKKVKENLYMDVSYVTNMRRTLIPWSPAYDAVLGGGIVSGGLTNMIGAEKTGKTSALLQLCANCQRPEYGGRYWDKAAAKERGVDPGRPVIFYNVENRLTKRDINSTPNLNLKPDKFMMVGTTDKNTLYLEDYFENIEQTIDLYPGCVILIDSIGALCTKKVAAATDGDQVRDPAPLLTSALMKRIAPLLMPKDIIMLSVLHKVTNTGAKTGQSTTTITGGKKLKYAANNQIDIKWKEIDSDDETCLIQHLHCHTSELGPPDEEAVAMLKLGYGLYREYELLDLCTSQSDNNLFGVSKSGSWYKFSSELTGTKAFSVQGILPAARWLTENPNIYQAMYDSFANVYFTNRKLYVK